MSNENLSTEDLQDQLLDRALREVVGGQSPPDLSEKIMLAVTGESDRKKVARASADRATLGEVRQEPHGANSQRNRRIGIAIAACVLVGALIVFPISLATLESPEQVQPIAKLEKIDSAGEVDREKRLSFNAYGEETDFIAIPEASDGSDPAGQEESLSGISEMAREQNQPGGQANRNLSELSVIPGTFSPRNSKQEWDSNTGRPSKKDRNQGHAANEPQLVMGATPRIIVQEQEEERLGLVTDGVVDGSGGRGGIASDSASQQPADAREAKDPFPKFTADLGMPFRRNSFGNATPGPGDEGGIGGQNHWDNVYYFRRTEPNSEEPAQLGQRYRIDASPGKEVNRYLFQMPTTETEGTRLKVKVHPVPDLVLPVETASESAKTEPDQLALVRGFLPPGLAPGNTPALVANKQEIERQLREKMDAYYELSEEIGGATDAASNSKVNLLVGEVRGIQAEILKHKEALVTDTVNLQLIRKQVASPKAVEQVIAEALEKDPILEAYRAEEYAIKQKVRVGKQRSRSSQVYGKELRRLETSLQELHKEAYAYKVKTEREIREELKKSPNTALDLAMTEHVLRRRNVEGEIAKLNKRYEEKVALIEQLGEDSRLDILKTEIEQLTEALEEAKHPDTSRDRYARIHENPFVKAEGEKAVSTFSIDVDTASYANTRQFLMQSGQLPPPDAVRIEELVNYFDYDYTPPTDDTPFAAHVEVAGCPWKAGHRLVRVGIKGREIDTEHRPQSNLVFLVDVSGSMNEPAKLPLLVDGMKMLTRELGENDRIAIVVYASSEGLALPSTRGDQQDKILSTLDNLRAGGSTAGGAGIQLAYEIAEKNFIKGGVNRVILATDGDFNVGLTDEGGLTGLAEEKAKDSGVFLTVLGFGRGNLNDSMMEKISNAGNGNYHYVDNTTEARKVLVAEMAGTLVTIAKDVKIQIEFNPAEVAAYRLIGYENRMLKTEDFNDDQKDAGEIGAGHTVTAIYEVIPAGQTVNVPAVDPLKYQQPATAKPSSDDDSGEILTLKLRYKQPDEDVSTKLEFPITDNGQAFAKASEDFKFASAVASFGMLLRNSQHQGLTSYNAVEEIANDGLGKDKHGYRTEFLQLVRRAKQLAGE